MYITVAFSVVITICLIVKGGVLISTQKKLLPNITQKKTYNDSRGLGKYQIMLKNIWLLKPFSHHYFIVYSCVYFFLLLKVDAVHEWKLLLLFKRVHLQNIPIQCGTIYMT